MRTPIALLCLANLMITVMTLPTEKAPKAGSMTRISRPLKYSDLNDLDKFLQALIINYTEDRRRVVVGKRQDLYATERAEPSRTLDLAEQNQQDLQNTLKYKGEQDVSQLKYFQPPKRILLYFN